MTTNTSDKPAQRPQVPSKSIYMPEDAARVDRLSDMSKPYALLLADIHDAIARANRSKVEADESLLELRELEKSIILNLDSTRLVYVNCTAGLTDESHKLRAGLDIGLSRLGKSAETLERSTETLRGVAYGLLGDNGVTEQLQKALNCEAEALKRRLLSIAKNVNESCNGKSGLVASLNEALTGPMGAAEAFELRMKTATEKLRVAVNQSVNSMHEATKYANDLRGLALANVGFFAAGSVVGGLIVGLLPYLQGLLSR